MSITKIKAILIKSLINQSQNLSFLFSHSLYYPTITIYQPLLNHIHLNTSPTIVMVILLILKYHLWLCIHLGSLLVLVQIVFSVLIDWILVIHISILFLLVLLKHGLIQGDWYWVHRKFLFYLLLLCRIVQDLSLFINIK